MELWLKKQELNQIEKLWGKFEHENTDEIQKQKEIIDGRPLYRKNYLLFSF